MVRKNLLLNTSITAAQAKIKLRNKTQNKLPTLLHCQPGASISIVSDYDSGSIPDRDKKILLWPLLPDCPWGPPSQCTMGTWSLFLGSKVRSGRDTDHSPLFVTRYGRLGAIRPVPLNAFMACSGTTLPLYGYIKRKLGKKQKYKI
jgi:hypothetical protein